jgi:hypothetical protein
MRKGYSLPTLMQHGTDGTLDFLVSRNVKRNMKSIEVKLRHDDDEGLR